jgi:hypothetical protein
MKIPSCFRLFTIVLAVTLGGVVRGAATAPKAPSSLVAPIVVDLAPGPGNPRNSEGAFLELKNGSILFVYSRFVGTSFSDEAKARLAARHSADGGETWSKDTLIETPEENDVMNVMSVSLLRFGNGDVGLFYLLRRSWHDMRMWCRRSTDEGRTWGSAIQCMPAAGYYVVNNDRVVRLASGRLVIPAAVHPSLADRNASSAVDWRGVAEFFLSDDDGRTWRKAKGYGTLPGAHTRSGLQEPGVVELRNGVLWAWARTDLGRQYECFSHDGGETWSVPAPSRFTSPNSPLSMKPIGGDRTPLVLATGVLPAGAWSRATLLDGMTEADEGYCYTAIHFTKDAVLVGYSAGGEQDKNRLARLRMRKLPLSALK